MSWGERSCRHFGAGTCPIKTPTELTCTHHCREWLWDGVTKTEEEIYRAWVLEQHKRAAMEGA